MSTIASPQLQRGSSGNIAFIALQAPNWVVYTPDDIAGDGNLFRLMGDLLQMQVYGLGGLGKAYGEPDGSDALRFRAAVIEGRRRQHTEQGKPITL